MNLARKVTKAVFRAPILAYRFLLSPITPPTCRHLPSCADYAAQAIDLNGAWKGGWLAFSRILRCNPWGSHGFDPAPDLSAENYPLAPWRYGRWTGRHIVSRFHEPCSMD